jgi:hypothetical protein
MENNGQSCRHTRRYHPYKDATWPCERCLPRDKVPLTEEQERAAAIAEFWHGVEEMKKRFGDA